MNRTDRRAMYAVAALAAFILPMAIHAATFDRSYANHAPVIEDRRTLPTIPAGIEQLPTTTVSIDSPEPTFSDRLKDRAESGGGEYLPLDPPFTLDAPSTTVADVIADVVADQVESTTTVEDWTDEGTVTDDTTPTVEPTPSADTVPPVVSANPSAFMPPCLTDESGPEIPNCYWNAALMGNGQGQSFFIWYGVAYNY